MNVQIVNLGSPIIAGKQARSIVNLGTTNYSTVRVTQDIKELSTVPKMQLRSGRERDYSSFCIPRLPRSLGMMVPSISGLQKDNQEAFDKKRAEGEIDLLLSMTEVTQKGGSDIENEQALEGTVVSRTPIKDT